MAVKTRDDKQGSIHVDRPQPRNLSMTYPNFVVEVKEVQREAHVEYFGIRIRIRIRISMELDIFLENDRKVAKRRSEYDVMV